MADYWFEQQLVIDPIKKEIAPGASVTLYDIADTGNASPLGLKDANGLPVTNPLTSSAEGFVAGVFAPVVQVKYVAPDGLAVIVATSFKAMLDEAIAAKEFVQGIGIGTVATGITAAASIDETGKLSLILPQGPKGDTGPAGPTGPQGPGGAVMGIFENFAPANFRRFRAALARQRDGGQPAGINIYGDSDSSGYQANLMSDYRRGFGGRAARILDRDFWPANDGIIFTRIGGIIPQADPRFTLGAGWSEFADTSQGPAGSGSVQGGANSAGTLDITLDSVDSFTVYQPSYSTGSTAVAVWIDNDAPTTVNAQGANGIVKTTVKTTSVGTHTLHIKNNSSSTAYVLAVEGFDSTNRQMRVTAVGVTGGDAGKWNTPRGNNEPWTSQQIIWNPDFAGPDLVVINMSINPHNNGMDKTTYKTAMTTMIQNAKAVADVILIASAPGGAADYPGSTWADYLQWQRELAIENNAGLINMQDRWGPYATANAAPYLLWHDQDHPTTAGYWDLGQALADAVRLAAGRAS